jgi:hypothetical protein
MVVDGSVGEFGSNRDEVNAAILRAKRNEQAPPDVSASRNRENVAIRLGIDDGKGKVLLMQDRSRHQRGIYRVSSA